AREAVAAAGRAPIVDRTAASTGAAMFAPLMRRLVELANVQNSAAQCHSRSTAHPPRRLHPALRSLCAPCSRSSLYDCAKKPLRASGRDHDPGRLSARPASLGGLRPAMAADRAIRGTLASTAERRSAGSGISNPEGSGPSPGCRPEAFPVRPPRRDRNPDRLPSWATRQRALRIDLEYDRT